MNAPSLPAGVAVTPGRVYLSGRLLGVRKAGNLFVHLMVLPAPDEYSSPATVEIVSEKRLGQVAEDLQVTCRVGGFKRSYKSTDKDTGEVRQVMTADNKLFAVAES